MKIEVHHYFHSSLEEKKLDEIIRLLKINNLNQKIIMANLDELEAAVAADTEVDQSAITLLNGLKAALDAAGTDAVKLKALSDKIGTSTSALAAAVVANTPAAE